jgi:hypothetical protein
MLVYLILALIIWVSAVQIFAGIYDEQITGAAQIELRMTTAGAESAAFDIDRAVSLVQWQGGL